MKHKSRQALKMMTALLLIMCGLALIVVPQLMLAYNDSQNDSMIEVYEKIIADNPSEDLADEILSKAQDYNNRLYLGLSTTTKEYAALLSEDDNGMMGYVNIPALDLRIPLFHDRKGALEQGAIHVLGSSLPVGGESSHCVIAAHTGNQNGRFFTDLTELKKGDEFTVHVLGRTLRYKVFRIKTVLPDDLRYLQIKEGKDYCTLLTCTPYGINSHRLLVAGKRVQDETEILTALSQKDSGKQPNISTPADATQQMPSGAKNRKSSKLSSAGFDDDAGSHFRPFGMHIGCEGAGTLLLVALVILQLMVIRRRSFGARNL